ncbi:MAG: hypothetical protein AVDCRST_MAG02-2606, partial [uncultured Rubrobacteraceae bacterium]
GPQQGRGGGVFGKVWGAACDPREDRRGARRLRDDGLERLQPPGSALGGSQGPDLRDGQKARLPRAGSGRALLEAAEDGRGGGPVLEPAVLRLRRPGRGLLLERPELGHGGGGSWASARARGPGRLGRARPPGRGTGRRRRVRDLLDERQRAAVGRGPRQAAAGGGGGPALQSGGAVRGRRRRGGGPNGGRAPPPSRTQEVRRRVFRPLTGRPGRDSEPRTPGTSRIQREPSEATRIPRRIGGRRSTLVGGARVRVPGKLQRVRAEGGRGVALPGARADGHPRPERPTRAGRHRVGNRTGALRTRGRLRGRVRRHPGGSGRRSSPDHRSPGPRRKRTTGRTDAGFAASRRRRPGRRTAGNAPGSSRLDIPTPRAL